MCPQFREMHPHGVDNYCCGGGSGFAIIGGHNFPEWRFHGTGRRKFRQILNAFQGEKMDKEHPKYVCAPCSNCKGAIRDILAHVHLCAQRVLSLSTLWQLESWQGAPFNFCLRKDLLEEVPGSQSFSPPLYIVALCSNSALPETVLTESNSFYLDISNSDPAKLSRWADQLTSETMKGREVIENLQQQLKERTSCSTSRQVPPARTRAASRCSEATSTSPRQTRRSGSSSGAPTAPRRPRRS